MMMRPRPPVADHSSFATRSSLFARIVRQRTVTLLLLALTFVCEAVSLLATSHASKGERTWKRYATPKELYNWLSRGSLLVQERMSLEEAAIASVEKPELWRGDPRGGCGD